MKVGRITFGPDTPLNIPRKGRDKMKEAILICICGKRNKVVMAGNNNADGKSKCQCGRNITIHLRRNHDN